MNETPTIWANGGLMPADALRVSPFDLGLAVGHGVFETMVAHGGVVFALDRHLERLGDSLEKLSMPVPERAHLRAAVSEVVSANRLTRGRARVRISVGGGDNPLAGGKAPGNVIVTAVPQPDPAAFARVIISPYTHNENSPLAGIKSASYGANLLAYRHAVAQGADEALMPNTQGALCEGTMSNFFLVHGDSVTTPPLDSGCLPGITRAIVIGLCASLQIPCDETTVSGRELHHATGLFLTSSARGVQPAVMDLADLGCPCAVTARIASAYAEIVRNETKA